MPAVFIKVDLDEKGVVQGAQRIEDGFKSADDGLKKVGQRGNVVLTGLAKDTVKAREAAMLLSNTLGIQLPAGLEKVLAKLPGLSGALTATFRATVVLAIIAAVVQLVNNFDSLKNKIMDAGYQLSIFGERMRSLVGLGDQDLLNGEEYLKVAKIKAELVSKEVDARRQALTIGKEGFEAIKAQAELQRQMLQDAENAAKGAAGEEFKADPQKRLQAFAEIHQVAIFTQKQIDANMKASADALAKNIELSMQQAQAEINKIGLAGIALVLQEEKDQVDLIPLLAKKGQVNAGEARVQAHERATKQILQMEKEFQQQVGQMDLDAAASNADGLAAIAAKTRAQIGAANTEFKKQFGDNFVGDPNDPESQKRMDAWVNAYIALQKKIGIIEKDGAAERQRLHQQSLDQILAAESEAAVASVPEWERGEAQIVAAHAERVREIKEQLDKTVLDEAEAARATAAADRLMNAQLIDEHKRMAEQLGSDLESAYDDMTSGNIGKRILSNMKKLFFEIVAAWVLSVGAMKSGFGQILGGLVFGGSTSGGLLGAVLGGGSSPASATSASSFAGGSQASASAASSIVSGMTTPGQIGFLTNNVAFSGNLNSGSGSASTGGIDLGPLTNTTLPGGATVGGSSGLLGLAGGIGMLGGQALASKFGGNAGSIGGMLLGMTLMGGKSFNALVGGLMKLGLSGSAAVGVLSGIGGGLLGFGVGSQFGKLAGGLSGGLTGGLTALAMGAGPWGIAIAGIIGLLGGIFGGVFGAGKRERQANMIADQVIGNVNQILNSYKTFQTDYNSSLGSLNDLQKQAESQLSQLKGEGDRVMTRRVQPAIGNAIAEITGIETERQRRGGLEFAPPMFHSGGYVGSVGSREVEAILREGEFVMNPKATSQNRSMLEAMNAGVMGAGDIHINGPLIQTDKVDQAWLRNGGALQILRALQGLRLEGVW